MGVEQLSPHIPGMSFAVHDERRILMALDGWVVSQLVVDRHDHRIVLVKYKYVGPEEGMESLGPDILIARGNSPSGARQ
jgi:hypothetical protein